MTRVESGKAQGSAKADSLAIAYGTAFRHLAPLLVPGLVVLVPLGLVALVIFPFVAGDTVAVVNGVLTFIGPPGTPFLVWATALVVASLAGAVLSMAGTVTMAGGYLQGRPLNVREAMGVAVSRWPALVVMLVASVVAPIAVAAVWVVVAGLTDSRFLAFAVAALVGFLALPCLLWLPAVVLEGHSAAGGLVRAYSVFRGPAFPVLSRLAVAALVVPGGLYYSVRWAVARLDLPLADAVTGGLGLLVMPFTAAVVATLSRWEWPTGRWDVEAGRRGWPESESERLGRSDTKPGSRARVGAVAVALVLPGLLCGLALQANPLGWRELSDRVVPQSDAEGPRVSVDSLMAVLPGQGGRVVMHSDRRQDASLLVCADVRCQDYDFEYVNGRQGFRSVAGSAALPDGRVAVVGWTWRDSDGPGVAELRVLICDGERCAPPPGSAVLAEVPGRSRESRGSRVALAATPGGGLVAAHLVTERVKGEDVEKEDVLRFTFCHDLTCANPRTVTGARLEHLFSLEYEGHPLGVAVSPDGRATAVRVDRRSGAVIVVGCDTPACGEPRVSRPAGPVAYDPAEEPVLTGAAVAVRPDGRPVVAYRHPATGAATLLDCATWACERAASLTLTGSAAASPAPALAVDRAGRILVAAHDLTRGRLVLATCHGVRCATIDVAETRYGPGSLAMTLDGADRPVIAWTDAALRGTPLDLRITVPLNIP
ncbi:hypothetical protein [Nonomuraea sp. NPDC046570]|uniref:hypothetical protein n=1 Tax=Nonomuraea sp. NPDC046570 TaxID=3155255 RepID=UPI003404EF05